jgi:hypothetical protein
MSQLQLLLYATVHVATFHAINGSGVHTVCTARSNVASQTVTVTVVVLVHPFPSLIV